MIRILRWDNGEVLHSIERDTIAGANLEGALLGSADLRGADLSGANLSEAYLANARLENANLSNAYLYKADLQDASLREANLSEADLHVTTLYGTDLTNANLSGSILAFSDFSEAYLSGAHLFNAMLNSARFLSCHGLHEAKGINTISHHGASSLDLYTIRASIRALPDVFLEGCGYTRYEIDYLRSLYVDSPIKYFSCFISHAEADMPFANRLLADLRQNNVSCWHYMSEMRGGRDWQQQIDEAIKKHDKLLLICSRRSVYRANVVKEIMRAIHIQRDTGVQKLFPIRLDDHILSSEMKEEATEMVRADKWPENWVMHVTRKHIPDFSGWDTDNAKYEAEFKKLLEALNSSAT